MKNKEPWAPKKFGHPKRTLSGSDISLTVEIYEEQKSGARRLEKNNWAQIWKAYTT
jgi:hypothetical protein